MIRVAIPLAMSGATPKSMSYKSSKLFSGVDSTAEPSVIGGKHQDQTKQTTRQSLGITDLSTVDCQRTEQRNGYGAEEQGVYHIRGNLSVVLAITYGTVVKAKNETGEFPHHSAIYSVDHFYLPFLCIYMISQNTLKVKNFSRTF